MVETGDQQNIYNLTTIPRVQQSLCVEEITDDSSSTRNELLNGVVQSNQRHAGTLYGHLWKSRRSKSQEEIRARKEASAQEVRGNYKQFAEAKRLEWKSWIDNEVFDLVDMRKFKPKNYVTRRWVLTIKTDKQGNFLRAKARWVLRGFQDKQKDDLQTDSPASTRPGFRMNFQMAASKNWDLFHMNLKTAFLSGRSCGVNRDVVCQLPPEASHPPCCCKTEETCM